MSDQMVAYQRKTPPHPPTISQGQESPHSPDPVLQAAVIKVPWG